MDRTSAQPQVNPEFVARSNSSLWIFPFPSREFIPSKKFPLNFLDNTVGGKFQDGKEKILSGLCKQVPPVSNGLFQHQEEMIQKCPGIFFQNFYSVGSAKIFSQNRSVNSLMRDLSIYTTFNPLFFLTENTYSLICHNSQSRKHDYTF
jgi:hypothetical protein